MFNRPDGKYQSQNNNEEGSNKMAEKNCNWYDWSSAVGIGIFLAGTGILLYGLSIFLGLFIRHGPDVTTSITVP